MEFHCLHDGFGAEVRDFDLATNETSAERDALRRAYDEHQLLLFRCAAPLSPERQLEVSSWFGPVADHIDGKRWAYLRNENPVGSARILFHQDFSYTPSPLKGISLHAIEVPPGGTSTSFVSDAHAWATLSAEQQQRFSAMTLRHHHHHQLMQNAPDAIAEHPLRLVHPRTGTPLLFATEHHAQRIVELEPEDSDRAIAELLGHIYAPGNVYVHRWQLYDLVIWDNLAIQHAREEEAAYQDGPRVMQRIALNEVSLAEMVEGIRQRAA